VIILDPDKPTGDQPQTTDTPVDKPADTGVPVTPVADQPVTEPTTVPGPPPTTTPETSTVPPAGETVVPGEEKPKEEPTGGSPTT